MSGDLLSIRETTDGDDDVFAIELLRNGEAASGLATLPRGQLAASDLTHVLSQGDAAAVGDAVDEYRAALVQAISLALAQRLSLSGERPLTVVVEGGPKIHAPIWEALRDPTRPPGRRALVVRVPGPEETTPVPPETTTGELVWLGARPVGEADIPRHVVAGRVLAAMLRDDSALRPRAVRTDASEGDLEPVLLAPGHGTLLVHLDAHGKSHIEPGGSLVDAVFSFFLRGEEGPVQVDDERLRSLLATAGCTLFTTNACFGAQQRGVMELPLPAQVVEDGAEVAVAAREPLAADAATVFFHTFYGRLSEPGTSIGTAFATATDTLMPDDDFGSELSPDRGRALRALLQPVLWARNRSHTERAFGAPDECADAVANAVCETVAMSSFDGTVAAVAAAVEDAAWDSPPRSIRLQAEPACGLSDDLLEALPSSLARLCRPKDVKAAGATTTLPVPALTEPERSWLISRRFSGRSTFLQLLVELLDDDVAYLEDLRERSGGEALPALLDALMWGASAPDPRGAVEIADPEFESVLAERRRQLARGAENAKSPPDILGLVAALPLALPLSSFDGGPILRVPTIAARGDPQELFETFESGQIATVLRADERLIIRPHPRTQLRARAAIHPVLVLLMREAEERSEEDPSAPDSVNWNHGTRLACLSWISIAIAARQLGGIDLRALAPAMLVLSSLDRGAAPELIAILEGGLPGWEPLIDAATAAFTHAEAALASDELADSGSKDRADLALDLLHKGDPEAVLELLEDADQLDFDEHKTLCYALAHTGRPEAARQGAARYLPQLSSMPLWDQCELLHLLGDLAEREGKIELAARFMLDERKLKPPAPRVRLHNRTHLIDVLLKLPRLDVDLIIQLAKEAVLLAAELDREQVRQRYLGLWIHLVVGEGREAKLAELGELEPAPLTVDSPAGLRLAHGIALLHEGDRMGEAVPLLLGLTDREGWETGQACLHLAQHEALPSKQLVEVLRRGSGVSNPAEASRCRAWQIAELWRNGKREEATRLAEDWAEAVPLSAAGVLAACAADAGEVETATELLGVLIVQSGRHVLTNPRLLPMVKSLPDEAVANALDSAIAELMESVAAHVPSPESEFDVAGALARLGEILELAIHSRAANPGLDQLANELARLSEGFWDHERLDPAAQAREIACAILAVGGDRAKHAIEVSWLATLQRLRGRVRDSEVGFQRAIELGTGVLPADELSSIYGRYGNLLHDVGSFSAAVDLQWSSLRLISAGVADAASLDVAALQAVAAGGPDPEPLGPVWLLRMANLANCLIDLPNREAAEFLLRAAVAQIDLGDSAAVNGREAQAMLGKVATRLGLIATGDIGAESAVTE